jgi:hypothetical protein
MNDYGGVPYLNPRNCYRLVYDNQGRPTGCRDPALCSGWLEVGEVWVRVDSCGRHSGVLRQRQGLPRG